MALLTVRLIHETDDAQECQQDFPRVGYHPTYRGDNEVYLCRSLRESRRSGPGLALIPFSLENQTAEPKKGTSCAVDLNFPIGSETAESEPWGLVVCLIRLSHSNNEDTANKSENYVLYVPHCCYKHLSGGPTKNRKTTAAPRTSGPLYSFNYSYCNRTHLKQSFFFWEEGESSVVRA